VAQLLHLESDEPDSDISIYVNSPGGSVYAGLTIYDAMQFVKPDIQTTCVGVRCRLLRWSSLAARRGSGRRCRTRRSCFTSCPPASRDQAADIEIQAREITSVKRRLEEILAEHSGQPLERVSKDMERATTS
jgi:ATP-dependent Clp protease protease subunit